MSIADWSDMLVQQVTIAPVAAALNSYAERTYGTAVTYSCRIAGRRRKVVDANGREVVSEMTIYLGSAAAIGLEDQVTLSTADAWSTQETALRPSILAIGRFPDQAGAHHTEIYLVFLFAAWLLGATV